VGAAGKEYFFPASPDLFCQSRIQSSGLRVQQ